MFKKLLVCVFVINFFAFIKAQSFSLIYPFTAVTSTSGATDPTPSPTATGVMSGSFTAAGLYSNPSVSGLFSFQGWPAGSTPSSNVTFTGSLDPAKYFEIVLNPSPNYVVSLTNMYFYVNRSGSGARHWAVRTNKDNYAANLPAIAMATNAGTVITVQGGDTFFWSDWAVTSNNNADNVCKVSFSGADFTDQFVPYHIRINAWDGSSTAGAWRIDSVAINGSATFSLNVGLPFITHNLNAGFKLYPNPAGYGFVTVEALQTDFSQIEVIDVSGKVVSEQHGKMQDKVKLDLTVLPLGIYFVRITSENKILTEKLIISK